MAESVRAVRVDAWAGLMVAVWLTGLMELAVRASRI